MNTRREPDSLHKLVVLAKVEGKRPRGRSSTRWSDQIRAITGLTLPAAQRGPEDKAGRNRFANVSVKAFKDEHNIHQ